MSDEESFVILGSSPLSSLVNDGVEAKNDSVKSSLQSDTCSRFQSLKESQINDLKNAQEMLAEKRRHRLLHSEMGDPIKTQVPITAMSDKKTLESGGKQQAVADSELSKPQQNQVEENTTSYSLERYALKSPTEENFKEKMHSTLNQESFKGSCNPNSTANTTPLSSVDNNLATSFIMGEVNSDVLKTSIYSQFPNICMEACAEDVMKLQDMVTDYTQLKSAIKKANSTMKQFYNNSLQWKEKMRTMEEQYKQQLDNCKEEIAELRKQNKEIETNFKMQIEAVEVARIKDREENVKDMSEKNALIENMRAQIIKLEQQQLAFSEYADQNKVEKQFDKTISHQEYELKIKDLQKQLSEMSASNLDLQFIAKQYVDELNCLKVNLAAADELIKKNTVEIRQLVMLSLEKKEQIQTWQNCLETLRLKYDEQKERISLLENQIEVYRSDFQVEKESRETAVREKQRTLQDLRSLQKINQELIEEHQKMANDLRKNVSAATSISGTKFTSAPAAAQNYYNNPQGPIRVSDALPTTDTAAPQSVKHMCPICNKAFKSLSILLGHVNDCVDKN